MKKYLMILLSLMLVVPMMAQYRRPSPRRYPSHVRPANSYYRPHASYRSQSEPTDVYFGLRLGGSLSNITTDDRYYNGDDYRTGMNAGIVLGVQMGYSAPVYFETGLSYVEKGGKGRWDASNYSYHLNYLEMPLVIKYNVQIDDIFSIQPFVGGFAAVGIDGKFKDRDYGQRTSINAFDKDMFKRFDGGLRAGCGFQIDHLYGEIGCDFGLANISHDNHESVRTNSVFATLGLNF